MIFHCIIAPDASLSLSQRVKAYQKNHLLHTIDKDILSSCAIKSYWAGGLSSAMFKSLPQRLWGKGVFGEIPSWLKNNRKRNLIEMYLVAGAMKRLILKVGVGECGIF